MIFGLEEDGTYVVEFSTSDGDVLAISIPRAYRRNCVHISRHPAKGYVEFQPAGTRRWNP
jgi:hypothetical protein